VNRQDGGEGGVFLFVRRRGLAEWLYRWVPVLVFNIEQRGNRPGALIYPFN